MADNASDSVQEITKALQRYNNAISTVNNSSRGLSSALDSLKETVESTSNALMSSEVSFTKYTKTVDDSAKFLKRTAMFALEKLPGTRLAVLGAIEAARGLVNAVLESNDAQLQTFDAVSKLGIGIGTSAEGFTKISNEAGFWSKNNSGLLKSYERLGNGLTNLGQTTKLGAEQFGRIVKTGDGVVDGFMRLGVSQSELVYLQAEYVSTTQMLGTKYAKSEEKLREESRTYVTSIVALSRLTGENITQVSARIAEQARDIQFNVRLRMLRQTEKGKLLADKYQEAEAMAAAFFGDDDAKAVRDFLASGTATTKEGEALLVKTRGQISQWKADLDAGRITQYQFVENIAKAGKDYEEQNRRALVQNVDFQRKAGVSVQAINGYEKFLQTTELEAIRRETELYKKGEKAGEKVKDQLKDTQIANFKAAQTTGIAKDKLVAVIQEPVNGVLRRLADLVKQTAIGTIKLGAWLLRQDTSKIDESLIALGDTTRIADYIKTLDKSIQETDVQINAQKSFSDFQKENEKKIQAALARQKELKDKMSQTQAPKDKEKLTTEIASTEREIRDYQEKISASKKEEKEKFGQTSEELQTKRENLVKNKKVAETKKIEGDKAQVRKESAYKTYIEGKGSEYERWTKVDPTFQEKVLSMARKYFEFTGKKLKLTSSYRSEEEQQEMYDAWRAAGGRYPWETNPNPKIWTEKYGWLYMPSNKPGGHQSGTAVDIHQEQLDWLEKNGYLDDFGLRRHYPIENDPVHVVPKAKDGGIFGPGLIEMHGKEAKVGMNGNTIPIELKQSGNMNDFSNMRGSISKPKIYSPNTTVAKPKSDEFALVLMDKIDSLNRKISESNSIYSDIKLYMSN
jgi:hypothetical protein